jgi:hypothetical protein
VPGPAKGRIQGSYVVDDRECKGVGKQTAASIPIFSQIRGATAQIRGATAQIRGATAQIRGAGNRNSGARPGVLTEKDPSISVNSPSR